MTVRHHRYLREILAHAGFTGAARCRRSIGTDRLIVASAMPRSIRRRATARHPRSRRRRAVVTGGTAGLDDLLGATANGSREGYLATFDRRHPVTAGLPEPLHVFGGSHAHRHRRHRARHAARRRTTATPLGDAVVTRRVGQGATVAIGPDIAGSVLHIQLGRADP